MQKQDTIKERLALFLKHLNIGQAKFAETVGASKGFANNVGDSIRSDNLKKISTTYPGLNIAWLQTGVGEMLNNGAPQPPKQLELDFKAIIETNTKIADANKDLARSVSEIVKSNATLVGDNSKILNLLVDSIARIESKLDKKGALVSKSRHVL